METSPRVPLGLALACLCLGVVATAAAGAARANDAVGSFQQACPRLASPAGQSYLQPQRLLPSQVQAKNKLGCLSPADAIYGPDGCPSRYCGVDAGVFQLPRTTP